MKKNKGIIIAIFVFLLIISIITISIVQNKKDKNKLINSELQEHFNNIPDDYYGLIDMENTDNVEIKNNEKTNVSKKLSEVHTFKQYEISNMKIFTKRDTCFITFDIKNLSYTGSEQQKIEFFFYDQNNNGIGSVTYDLYKNFTKGKKTNIKITHQLDFSNAYDYEMITFFE